MVSVVPFLRALRGRRVSVILTLGWMLSSTPIARLDAGPGETVQIAEDQWADGLYAEAQKSYREALALWHEASGEELLALAPEVELALRRLSERIGEDEPASESLETFRAWAEAKPGVAPEVRDFARYALGRALLASGRGVESAREAWGPLGFLENWRVVGPFENERGSAFLLAQEPEQGIDFDAVLRGKNGEIRWRELPRVPLAGDVDFDALFEPDDESLAFAVTFVRADSAVPALLGVGSDEGFQCWVNGQLVAQRDLKRGAAFDQDRIPISLHSGWNTILVEVGEAEGSWELTARLTALDEESLARIEEGTPPSEYLEEVRTLAASGEPPAEPPADPKSVLAIVRERIEKDASDARAWYLLGSLLLARSAHDENEHPDTEALRKSIALDPAPAIAHLELAKSLRRSARIAADRDDNEWRVALVGAAEHGSGAAALALSEYYLSTFGNISESRDWLERADELASRNPAVIFQRGRIESQEGFFRAMERAADDAAGAAPTSPVVRLDRAARLEEGGHIAEAEKILRDLLEENRTSRPVRDRLLRLLISRGETKEVLGLLEEASVLQPFDGSPFEVEANLALGADDPAAAAEALAKAVEIAPDDHQSVVRLAEVLWEGGERDRAIAEWERALELQPNLPDVRKRLEFLKSDRARFEDEVRRDVAALIAEGLAQPLGGSDDAARVLLDLEAVEVHRDGTSREFAQQVIVVLNDLGVRSYDRFGTPYSAGDQLLEFRRARVHHRDGSTADARLGRFGGGRGDGWRSGSVDLPPLSPGDVVEVEYVKEDLEQSFFGDYFGRLVGFQSTDPIGEKTFILRAPATRALHFHERKLDVEPEKSIDEKSESVTWTWTKRDIPAIDPEPGMPGAREVFPLLEVSTFASWDEFSSWYHHLIRKQFESSPEIRAKVAELVSGITDERERIRAIYDFVVTDVRYNAWEFGVHGFKPYNAATVFSRRFGDCKDKATLLCVMLGEAGITAHPVLIHAEPRRGGEDLTLPMVDHFNHCITFVPGSDARPDLFLDGTASFHGLDELPSMDRGARVLVVRDSGADLREIPWNSPEDLSIEEEWTVEIGVDRPSRLEVRIAPRGDYAVHFRQAFEVEGQRKTQIESAYGRRFAGTRLLDERFSNLGNLSEPVSLAASLEVPQVTSESAAGPSLSIPDDFFRTAESLGALAGLEERRFDVLLGSPRRSSLRVVYRLPEGTRVKSFPLPRAIEEPFGRLSLSITSEGNELVLERVIEITAPRVTVDQWPALRNFIAELERLDDERIVLARG